MTARRSGLKDAYDAVSSGVPAFGDVDLAIRTATRRRLRTAIGVPLLAAAAAAALVLSASLPRWSADPDPASTKPPPVGVWFVDWVPNDDGSAAKPGTVAYRDCADCPVRLMRPDGRSFALTDLRPDLASKVPAAGMEGLSLSQDGRWLGLRRGTAYELYDLASRWGFPVAKLPAGPAGSRWEPVGAGLTFAFARWEGEKVTAYAFVHPPTKPEIYQVPDGYDRLPVRAPFGTVIDAAPVRAGERLTSIGTDSLTIRTDPTDPEGPQPGTRGRDWSPGDFGAGLRPSETFAGPRGVPSVAEPVSGSDPTDSGVWHVATAYVVRGGAVVPSALLRLGMDDPIVRRIDIPVDWELLGPLDRDRMALGHRTGDGYEVVAFGFDGTRHVLHRLGPSAEVLLPGVGR